MPIGAASNQGDRMQVIMHILKFVRHCQEDAAKADECLLSFYGK